MGLTALAAAIAAGPVVLDGGLATRLEARGHDLSGALWSGRLLLERPDEVRAAHADFADAGALVATTASYQLSFEGLAAVGVDPAGTRRLLRRSVEVARDAMAGRGWVAASIGPYGAALADGSEYTGRYAAPSGRALAAFLRDWHARRLTALVEAGPDVLALETVPSLLEAQVLVELAAASGLPAWLSVTCAGARFPSGEPAVQAFSLARGVEAILAVGVNCCDPADATALVGVAARHSGKPVVAYPHSRERWDAVARAWVGEGGLPAQDIRGWVADGARLVGGCCRVTPADIAGVAALLGSDGHRVNSGGRGSGRRQRPGR